MADVEVFKHSPLLATTSQRLIRLVETTGEDPLAFEISEHESGYLVCYSALSYRWGSASSCRNISLNGKQFQVRQNLWHFLNQLRLERDRGYYWIDALCINQDDPLERNRSVIQAGSLFMCAQRVLIWLGHYESLERCFVELVESRKSTYLSEEDDATRSIARSDLGSAILKMQYWSRAWIVQEILLGRTVVVKCLAQQLPIEHLQHYFAQHQAPQPDVWRLKRAWNLLSNVQLSRDTRSIDWLFYLFYIADQECADPRDKAYSFLGLYCHWFGLRELSSSLDVDYRKSITTVYLDCVYMLLSSKKDRSKRSDQLIMQDALDLRQWLEKVLSLTPIENATDTDTSYLSLLGTYMVDSSISDETRILAEVTYSVSIAFGLAWSIASAFLPFGCLVFCCKDTKSHIKADKRGAAMLVPFNYIAEGNPLYSHLTRLARSRATAEWQCTSCFRIIGDFFLSDNQLRNEDSDRVRVVRTNDKGKTKVIEHNPFTVRPWHETVSSCDDCSFVEREIVRQLRMACNTRDWIKIPKAPSSTEPSLERPTDQSKGYDTLFSPDDRYLYYQSRHPVSSVIVLWISPGPKLSMSRAAESVHMEENQQSLQHDPRQIWFTASNPQSRGGCKIRVCSPEARIMVDPMWADRGAENVETSLADTERASPAGTDGLLSEESEESSAEESEKGLSGETEEALPTEKSGEPLETSEQASSATMQGDTSSVEQKEAADPEDKPLYNDSYVAWLTRPPPAKPKLPLQPIPQHNQRQ